MLIKKFLKDFDEYANEVGILKDPESSVSYPQFQ